MKKVLLLTTVLFSIAGVLSAADPYIGYLYPCGGKQGTRVKVLVGGQYLRANGFHIDGDGVKIAAVHPVYPMNNLGKSQRKYVEEWLEKIEKGDMTPPPLPPEKERQDWRKCKAVDMLGKMDDLARVMSLKSMYVRRNALQDNPSLRQMMVVELDIAPDAEPGARNIRNYSSGVSAPKLFYVDTADHFDDGGYVPPFRKQPERPEIKKFPAVLDGQIMPGESDSYTLHLEKGRKYYIAATARKLQPFIGDAVPGHFQIVLSLYDPEGKMVMLADDEYFNPDPVMRFVPEKSGAYTLVVRDAIYRGREDFVYRLECGEGEKVHPFYPHPFAGDIPLLKATEVNILTLDAGEEYVIKGIFAPGKEEIFNFSGRKNEEVVLETAARCCNSPADTVLKLYGPDGRLLAENDDRARSCNVGEIIQHTDSYIRVKLPADGIYRVFLSERHSLGGRDYAYYLRLGRPRPGFTVFTRKSAFMPIGRAQKKYSVAVERHDGFDGEIKFSSGTEDINVSGGIPAGKTDGEMILSGKVTRKNPALVFPLDIRAEGVLPDGKTVTGKVVAADEYMQAFAYMHLLPAGDFMVFCPRPAKRAAAKVNKGAKKAPPAKAPGKPAKPDKAVSGGKI